MENNTATPASLEEAFRHPGLFVFYIVIFFVISLTIAVFNVLILLFLCARSTAMGLSVRTVLCCLFVGSLLVTVAFMLENLTAFVLAAIEVSDPPPLPWCSFIVYLIGVGGSVRFVCAATFSVIVYVIIRHSSSTVSSRWILVCSGFLMAACFISAGPILSPYVVEVTFFGGVVCFPGPTAENFTNAFQIRIANQTFLALWLSLFGIVPFLTAVILPFVALWVYLHKKAVENVELKKCFLKLTVFLILESIANLCGLIIPVIASYFYNKSEDELGVFLFIDIITAFSLLLTPIGVMVFLKRVRHGMKSFYCGRCCSVNDSDSHDTKTTMHYRKWQEQKVRVV